MVMIEEKHLVEDILRALPIAVLLLDENLTVHHSNESFRRLWGLKESDCHGWRLTDIIDREMLDRAIYRAIDTTLASRGVEFRYRVHDQDVLYSADVIPMPGRHVLVIVSDITLEREKQERLYLTDRLASIGEMVAGVAHELNNPLTSVIGLAQLLLDTEEVPDTVRQDLKDINSEAQRAAMIVKNLLSFGRKRVPDKQMMQVNKIIQEVLNLRAYEHKVNNIEVKTILAPDLPELLLDQFQIQQVFLNIILNAESAMIESHHRGKLTINTEVTPYSVRITFTDDGPGIPAGLLNRIFDPFFTTKEVGKGTGLGLSICYGIVRAHNGTIFASSGQKSGARIIIELPQVSHPLNYAGGQKVVIR